MSRRNFTSTKKSPGFKMLECKRGCGNKSKVSEECTAVTCWRCVQSDLSGMPNRVTEYMNDDEFRNHVNNN